MKRKSLRARASDEDIAFDSMTASEERAQLKALLRLTREALKTYQSRFAVSLKLPDGTVRVLYKAQPVQDKLHACTAPNILFGGAAGGSKSHGLRWDAIIKCLQTAGLKALFLRRTYPELERTHLLRLPTELPKEIGVYNGNLKRLTFGNGSLIQFGHCQYEKDLADHLSTEWDVIYIDEASTFTPRMLELLPSRARTSLPPRNGFKVVPQFIVASNPGGDGHLFLETHFISKAPVLDDGQEYDPNEWAYIPAKVTDNAYITDAYIHRLLALSKTERDAYLYGKWSAFSGQFFREWDPKIHTTSGDGLELPPWMEREGGMDWGYDPDPFYVCVAAFDAFGRAWLYREITGHRSTPREVAEQIDAALPEGRERGFILRGDTQMWIKSPESGISIAEQINDRLYELGSQITLEQANKDRVNGWMRVRSYLNPRRRRPDAPGTCPWLVVVTPSEDGREMGCPYFIQVIGTMRHHDTKKGDMAPNAHDHPLDAGRYLLLARPPLSEVPMDEREVPKNRQAGHANIERFQKRLQAAAQQEQAAASGTFTVESISDDETLPIDLGDDDAQAIAAVWE